MNAELQKKGGKKQKLRKKKISSESLELAEIGFVLLGRRERTSHAPSGSHWPVYPSSQERGGAPSPNTWETKRFLSLSFKDHDSSSEVSELLESVSELGSGVRGLRQANKAHLRGCRRKPFSPKPCLFSCWDFIWNSCSSSSVSGRQSSSFSGDSCQPISFSNLCSASSE